MKVIREWKADSQVAINGPALKTITALEAFNQFNRHDDMTYKGWVITGAYLVDSTNIGLHIRKYNGCRVVHVGASECVLVH